MTDELNRTSAEPEATALEQTTPALLDEMHPTGADENLVDDNGHSKMTIELPPDWLKPMEEDEDEGVEAVRSSERITRRPRDIVPKVKRGRGRPRKIRPEQTRLDFKKELHADNPAKNKSVAALLKRKRSRLSSRTSTPVPDPVQTSQTLPKTLIIKPNSTMRRPRVIANSSAASVRISKKLDVEFHSPPRLTRVSPLSIDTTTTRGFIHSPSVKVGNVSEQTADSESGKEGAELPLRLWIYPSMEPISPTITQETFSDQTVGSLKFPEATLNGKMTLKECLPLLRECETCGCPFPAQKTGDTLCYRCKPKPHKRSPPNILVRKVSRDQWEVEKSKHPRKQILKPQPKVKKIEQMDPVLDGDGDDDDDDWALKKRNRRMCRQCVACLREQDCGTCDFCMDKPKFGGSNKKRQKCRLRQCRFQSKLQFRRDNRLVSPPRIKKMSKPKLKRRGRPKKHKIKTQPWEDDEDMSDNDDDEEELTGYEMNGSKLRGSKKWNYSFKDEEEDDMFVETVIEDAVPPTIEEDPVVLASAPSVMPSNEMFTNTSGLSSQGLLYNMSGMPVAPQMIGSVPLSHSQSNCLPLGEVVGTLPMGDAAGQNGFLQIEMVRVGSPPSHYTEEAQITGQHVSDPPPEHTPVISQIFSLAGPDIESERDQGLMDLFTALSQTVLPAHWVGVMAKGPVLQLLQCSKLSTMADTVVQIEKGFFYQVSVQNQPLLLMHAVYSRHPTCLENVGDVVSLLLDLEGFGVCQGYQNLDMCSPWEPRMCVRAALCDLLVPKDEEHCGKCSQPVEG